VYSPGAGTLGITQDCVNATLLASWIASIAAVDWSSARMSTDGAFG